MNIISPEELVKALNYYGVLVEGENDNTYQLVYNAKVHSISGEKCIVLETHK